MRTETPVAELADRLAPLRRAACQLTRDPRVGIATLADFAAAGVLLHAHAHLFAARDFSSGLGHVAAPPGGADLSATATAWRDVPITTLGNYVRGPGVDCDPGRSLRDSRSL